MPAEANPSYTLRPTLHLLLSSKPHSNWTLEVWMEHSHDKALRSGFTGDLE